MRPVINGACLTELQAILNADNRNPVEPRSFATARFRFVMISKSPPNEEPGSNAPASAKSRAESAFLRPGGRNRFEPSTQACAAERNPAQGASPCRSFLRDRQCPQKGRQQAPLKPRYVIGFPVWVTLTRSFERHPNSIELGVSCRTDLPSGGRKS